MYVELWSLIFPYILKGYLAIRNPTWYTKYTYWIARPFQRIANFTTVTPTPKASKYILLLVASTVAVVY